MNRTLKVLAGATLLALATAAMAQAVSGTPPATSTKPEDAIRSPGQFRVASRLALNFAGLAGSPENALALVNALRNGSEVTLLAPAAGGTGDPVSTTFTPPTGHMGWGNVAHALALAQASLTRAGITSPTNAELQAALMGGEVTSPDGTVVTLKGILQMRADGMGWGNIAKATGTKMGAVVSSTKGMQPKATSTAATTKPTEIDGTKRSSGGITTAAGSNAAGVGNKASAKGITAASGVGSSTASKGLVTAEGNIAAHGRSGGVTNANSGSGNGFAYGRGITTAAGGSVGAGAVAATSHGQGAGLVSGSGAAASAGASVSTAAGPGNGHGNANGQAQGGGKGKGG